MTLAADMSTTDSEPEIEPVEDSIIVFLPKALPVLLRINFVKKNQVLSILSVPKLIREVP